MPEAGHANKINPVTRTGRSSVTAENNLQNCFAEEAQTRVMPVCETLLLNQFSKRDAQVDHSW